MKYDASDPDWPDRDRFVLSAGHASMLLYSMLYLTGFGLELDDLRDFRQWGSRTPGHPEYRHTKGVEVTTGPLGQGFGERGRHRDRGEAPAGPVRRRRVRPPRVRRSAATATSWRASATRRRRSPVTCSSAAWCSSTTTTTSRSTAPTELTYSDDVPEAVRGVRLARGAARRGRRTTLDALEAGLRAGDRRRGQAVAARVALAHRLPVAQGRRTPRPRTATRSAPTRSRP